MRSVVILLLLASCSKGVAIDPPEYDCEPTRLKMIAETKAKLAPSPSDKAGWDYYRQEREKLIAEAERSDRKRLAALEGKPLPVETMSDAERQCRALIEASLAQ